MPKLRSQLADGHEVVVRLLGGNGADLTVDEGVGAKVTCPRSGEGAYTLTVTGENPGVFKTWHPGFGAATPADLAGYTVVRDAPVAFSTSTNTWTMPFVVYNSSFAAADLLVDQYLDLRLVFGVGE